MRFDTRRLRAPEWTIGIASALLLLDTFALPWYAIGFTHGRLIVTYPASALDGWNSLTVLRYLIVLSALLGLAVWWLQATRESPAIPTVLTVLFTIPSGLLLLALLWRVLIDNPGIHGLGSAVRRGKARRLPRIGARRRDGDRYVPVAPTGRGLLGHRTPCVSRCDRSTAAASTPSA